MLDRNNGEIWCKLDAGTEAYYRRINRSTVPLSRVLRNIALTGRRTPIVIQSMFIETDGALPDEAERDAYCDRLSELVTEGCAIKLVQVYTLARRPMTGQRVAPAAQDCLRHVAARLRELGLNAETYAAPDESALGVAPAAAVP
jgi:hypothetical protein